MKPFHKETFSKIDLEKKNRVIQTAISEFAAEGYTAANINVIAQKAGISVGSMYSYFASKEDLFLAVVEIGVQTLNDAVAELLAVESNLSDTLRRLLELTVRYTKDNPGLSKLYLNLSTEELRGLSNRLAGKIEMSFTNFYDVVLKQAMERGEIPAGTDLDKLAYFIDNQMIMLQLSLSTKYFADRIYKYLGAISEEDLVDSIHQHLLRSIYG